MNLPIPVLVPQRSLLSPAAVAAGSRSLRLRSREVDGWSLIIGSLVRGYKG